MAFGLNWGATSVCWILFHADSRTKQNQQQSMRGVPSLYSAQAYRNRLRREINLSV